MKTAVIYHYFEADEKYRENFVFFLNTAINEDSQYFIYISGECSVPLPKFKNVSYFFIENKNNDFGGVVEFYQGRKYLNFDAYIFINSSTRGPFLLSTNRDPWQKLFICQLSHAVPLVGSSINLLPETSPQSALFYQRHKLPAPHIHVQTTAYSLSAQGYKLLSDSDFFSQRERLEKSEVISDYEILMSQIIMKNGYQITSLLPTLENFSQNHKHTNLPSTSKNGDVLYKSAFYGRSISPFESVFIKTNRDIISFRDLCSYTFTSLLSAQNNRSLDEEGKMLLEKVSHLILNEELVFENISARKLIKSRLKNKARRLLGQKRMTTT